MAYSNSLSRGALDLIEQGNQLFNDRTSFMSLLQEIADNFYPERADFTTVRTLGVDFAANLNSSLPLLMRRELGESIGAVSRRKDTDWMNVSVKDAETLDDSGKAWLEYATGVQRSAMYDQVAQFERAAVQSDHDYATFGQGIKSQEINWKNTALLYRNWHIRDVAWCEGEDGGITDRHHNVKPSAMWLAEQFGENKLHQSVKECLQPGRNKYQKINCRRVVVPAAHYDDISNGRRIPWVSLYLDLDNQCLIDARPSWTGIYIISRWQLVSGSQYAFSPAAIAGLPDARLIQAMTLTLLEAGEMAVRPPMAAAGEVIQGGIQIYAGGITQIDSAYDERMGKPLYPIYEGAADLKAGLEMLDRKNETLSRAFYLNKLRAMPLKDQMTATEAEIWARDYIREAVPLFQPLEAEDNAPTCEQTFSDLMRANAFGSYRDIPQSIRGRDVEWKFVSPLTEAIDREKAMKFRETRALIAEAIAMDPATGATVNWRGAIRDALDGIRSPAKWRRSERDVEQYARDVQQQQQEAAQAEQAGAQAAAAADAGAAAESFAAVA